MKTQNEMPMSTKALPWLLGVVVLLLLIAGILAWFARAAGSAAPGSELALAAETLPIDAANALRGEPAAFAALSKNLDRVENLRAGLADKTLAADPRFDQLAAKARVVLAAQGSLQTISAARREAHDVAPKLLSELGDLASVSGAQKLDGMSSRLERFELTVQRMEQDLAGLAGNLTDAAPASQRLADGVEFLGQIVRGLSSDNAGSSKGTGDAETKLKAVVSRNQQFSAAVRRAIGVAAPLAKAQAAMSELATLGVRLAADTAPTPGKSAGGSARWLMVTLVLALLALAALAWSYTKSVGSQRVAEQRVRENDRNQEAIMRLLDELSSLADGDLTVQATVTEDITGAIADSINYAIEALRELVATINDTAIRVDAATKQTQTAASDMAKASGAQSRQISSASEAVADMAASIEEVSVNAERGSDVARHSVDVAHKGGDAVRRTIDGMNAIRETIQETSKRIKRLGESSQEIGNIVELINDIAEQTNILALNASIQASMAGEAGRGFAVVADEVQRLAERAANATKQIEVLVRTIQTDTNEAVVSMERSTTDVVGGALLAENAGAALEEIEQVSNQIASLVQNISASARQQASASSSISKSMQVLREISSRTADSSTATSGSMGKLAELASQLRKCVAGFRLPDYGSGTTTLGSSSTRLPILKDPAESSIRKASGFGG